MDSNNGNGNGSNKVMKTSILTYEGETWIPTLKGVSSIQAAKMTFLRKMKGCYRLKRVWSEDLKAELNVKEHNDVTEESRRKEETTTQKEQMEDLEK